MAFFQEPRGGGQPFLRAPSSVLILIALLIASFAMFDLAPSSTQATLLSRFGFFPALYSPSFLASHHIDGGSVWDRLVPFVSYMFLHGSWTHVILNSVWLLAFGPIVARRFGTALFFLFFLVCGVAGISTHLALNWGSPQFVIGASGGVSGLMGAAFRMIAVRNIGSERPGLAPLFSSPLLLWSGVWIATNVVAGLTGFAGGTEVQLVAWQAHIGGFVAGMLLAAPFLRFSPKLPSPAPDGF